ncbi:S1/P1 nuclease [Pedobacter duraquae]|uniref:S1/P1 nuclease n=1 Tax=Pedobacter duraquae TaxID=425511 RepID=A0A4R6IHD9_9SPHI|nr:S1/P1 nuclease [Pedobacter duraquae]TDO21436.1 S1/P1 nuclease [Pedobacter duraquae]
MNMLKKIKISLLAIGLFYVPLQASAWGIIGHRVVGQVADYYLTAKARKGVQSVLGSETLAMSANWPDFIKSDTAFNYLSSWHYVNLPEGLDQKGVFNFLETEKTANIYNKIPEMVATLKSSKSTAAEKKMAMRLLVHLMGDLHQPMHTARKDDLGGNKVTVTWFGQKSNLHRVWDEQLVDYQQLSYTEFAAAVNHPTAAQLTEWRAASLKQDVYESYMLCNKIYATTKADDKLSYRYNFDYADALYTQLAKGGVRLAALINAIYK